MGRFGCRLSVVGCRGIGKRGQIFSGILVLITVAMCLLSIGVYLKQQGEVQSSLVSPLVVLEVRDDLTVFEMREMELIKETLSNANSDFGSENFLREFRSEFLRGVRKSDMEDFIFWKLTLNGNVMQDNLARDTFLSNVVYNEALSSIDSSKMVFGRARIGKAFGLRAINTSKTNFAVDFSFDFEREYLITKRCGNFVVEVVE